jgi:hypothetical protein
VRFLFAPLILPLLLSLPAEEFRALSVRASPFLFAIRIALKLICISHKKYQGYLL